MQWCTCTKYAIYIYRHQRKLFLHKLRSQTILKLQKKATIYNKMWNAAICRIYSIVYLHTVFAQARKTECSEVWENVQIIRRISWCQCYTPTLLTGMAVKDSVKMIAIHRYTYTLHIQYFIYIYIYICTYINIRLKVRKYNVNCDALHTWRNT